MKKVSFPVVLITTLVLTNCNKETVPEVSKLDLLTGKQWKIDKLLYSVKGDPGSVNYTSAAFKSCELDDVYEFKKNDTFIRTDGVNICGNVALYGPYGTGSWNIDAAFTNLSIELFARYQFKYKVISISAASLQLERSSINYLQQEVLYTFYFKPVI